MEEVEVNAREVALREALGDVVYRHAKWDGRQTDWLLQWAARFIEKTDLSIGITLTIGGGLVSGVLISSKLYFETLSDDIAQPFAEFGDDVAESMRGLMLSFSHAEDHEDGAPAEQFLHLQDARVYTTPSGAISDKGVLWRGKVSAVQGFTFGQMKSA